MEEQKEAQTTSRNCSMIGYRVWVRTTLPGVVESVDGVLFGNEWKRLFIYPEDEASGRQGRKMLSIADCLDYHVAMIVAWQFADKLQVLGKSWTQVRITSHDVQVNWKCSDVCGEEVLPEDWALTHIGKSHMKPTDA